MKLVYCEDCLQYCCWNCCFAQIWMRPWGLLIVHEGDGLWEKAAPVSGCSGAKRSEGGQQVDELVSWVGRVWEDFPCLFPYSGWSAGSGAHGLLAIMTVHCSLLTSDLVAKPNQRHFILFVRIKLWWRIGDFSNFADLMAPTLSKEFDVLTWQICVWIWSFCRSTSSLWQMWCRIE